MRIAMVVQALEDFGGLEEIVTTLAVALRRQGHETAVVSTVWVQPDNQYKRHLERNGVPLVQWPFMRLMQPVSWMRAGAPAFLRTRSSAAATAAVRRHQHWACENIGWTFLTSKRHPAWTRALLAAFSARWRPDLIHIHSYVYDLNVTHVLDWTHARGLPTVFEEHQTPDPTRAVWNDFRARIDRATMVGAVSQKGAAIMRDHLGVRRPIRVLPPLVDDPTIGNDDALRPDRSAGPTITAVARLIPAKGLPYLFEAIATLRASHPTLQFRVHGHGPPRSQAEVVASAEHWGLDPASVFAGTFRRDALPAVMAGADIFVLPSLIEGFPLSVIEAMACGRAIVATAVGGVPDLVQDGVTGLLCPPGDAASLTRALRRLIEDPDERARLGRAARAAYERGPFHPEHATRDYLAMYEENVRLGRKERSR